ncbi:hypothetical protein VH22019_00040 [Vibrio phage VH2_2019]|nr:hypothetical protein VH22019_00040 [Vibrio phage VH2_2019]
MKNLMQQLDAITQSKSIDELTQVVSGDFSELEKKIIHHTPDVVNVAKNDIHKKQAMAMFGLKEHEVERRHREIGKRKNYQYIYSAVGMQDIPYPEHPTHCKTCLDPLRGHEDDAYNVCRWCNEGWVPVTEDNTGVMVVGDHTVVGGK